MGSAPAAAGVIQRAVQVAQGAGFDVSVAKGFAGVLPGGLCGEFSRCPFKYGVSMAVAGMAGRYAAMSSACVSMSVAVGMTMAVVRVVMMMVKYSEHMCLLMDNCKVPLI